MRLTARVLSVFGYEHSSRLHETIFIQELVNEERKNTEHLLI